MNQQAAAPAVQCICGKWLYTDESRARQRGPVCWAREHPGQPVARPAHQRAATGPPAARQPAIGGQLELDIPDPDRSIPVDTQPDRPATARTALLAFADELDDILDPAVIPPATIATITHLARERARSLPDDAVGLPAVAHLRAEIERLRLQLAGEPLAAELVGAPALDVDQLLRVHALDAAARVWHGVGGGLSDKGIVVRHARVFEAYLRGGR